MNQVPRKTRIAIDFGSTRTKVAYWHPETLQPTLVEIGKEQNYILPSVFYVPKLPETKILVGEDALAQMDADPQGIILGVKKKIHQIGKIRLGADRPEYSIINLITSLFIYIRRFCEEKVLFNSCEDCILTFPVTFEQRQIDQLIKAAKMAGFEQIQTVEEPVSAAMSWLKYKSTHQDSDQVIVCDIGGGTSDLAFLNYQKGRFVESDSRLKPVGFNQGGNDIDHNIWESIEQESGQMGSDWHKSRDAFCNQIRKAKEFLLNDFRKEIPLSLGAKEIIITRDRVQQESNPLVSVIIEETLRFVKKCQSICQQDKITLLLVGGGSRTPQLQESLELATNCPVIRWNYSDYATVLGALFHQEGVVAGTLPKTNKQSKDKSKIFQPRSLLVLASSVAIAISVAFGVWQILNFRKNNPVLSSHTSALQTEPVRDLPADTNTTTTEPAPTQAPSSQKGIAPFTKESLSGSASSESRLPNQANSRLQPIEKETRPPLSPIEFNIPQKNQSLTPTITKVDPATKPENFTPSSEQTRYPKVTPNDPQSLASVKPSIQNPPRTSLPTISETAIKPRELGTTKTIEKPQPLVPIDDSSQRIRAQQLEQKLKQIALDNPENTSPQSNPSDSNPSPTITIDQLSQALLSPTGAIPPVSTKASTTSPPNTSKIATPLTSVETKPIQNPNLPYQQGITAKNNKDYEQAFLLFQKAGSLGNAKALYELGNASLNGRGTKADSIKGRQYFERSAQAGYDKAQRSLGFLYEYGFGGIAKDMEQAKYWYQLAADQGNQEAIESLKRIP